MTFLYQIIHNLISIWICFFWSNDIILYSKWIRVDLKTCFSLLTLIDIDLFRLNYCSGLNTSNIDLHIEIGQIKKNKSCGVLKCSTAIILESSVYTLSCKPLSGIKVWSEFRFCLPWGHSMLFWCYYSWSWLM